MVLLGPPLLLGYFAFASVRALRRRAERDDSFLQKSVVSAPFSTRGYLESGVDAMAEVARVSCLLGKE